MREGKSLCILQPGPDLYLENEADEKEIFNGGYYSSVLDKHRKNLLPCEGEAIGMKLVLEHF